MDFQVGMWEERAETAEHRLDCDAAAPPDPRALRRALGRYATGVTVVTARAGAERRGGGSRGEFLHLRFARSAGWFAVNVLAADQAALSMRFATPGRADKFDGLACAEGLGGCPLLPGCLARFECRTDRIVEAGDHVMLIGRIARVTHLQKGEPLLFAGGCQGRQSRRHNAMRRGEA